jgi:hypothetical protein
MSLDLVWNFFFFFIIFDRQTLDINFLFVSSTQIAVTCFQTKSSSAWRRLQIWCHDWSVRLPASIHLSYMSSCKICFASTLGRVYRLLMPWNYHFWIRIDENWKAEIHTNQVSKEL